MVKIRLVRTGKKNEPHFRIVAMHGSSPRNGAYIQKIGYYNPRTNPSTLVYDKDILQKWIKNGAQMTDTVHDLFVKEGIVKQDALRTKRIKLIIETTKRRAEEKTSKPEAPADKEPEKGDDASDKATPKEPSTTAEEETQSDRAKDENALPKDKETSEKKDATSGIATDAAQQEKPSKTTKSSNLPKPQSDTEAEPTKQKKDKPQK